ncbi:MAG: hypothetical protein KJ793_06180 [Candidatus Omnitrophica bacterium]|nr:hypothetical protein [Candidatus Omnitrophota bacterium]
MKTNNKKQKHNTNELDFSPTPLQELLFETSQHNFNPQKVKKSFIELFGTEKIRIEGDMNLDEFIDEWCRVYRLEKESEEKNWKRQEQLIYMLIDLPNLYTEGQRKVWFSEVDEKD